MNGYITPPITQIENDNFFAERLNRGSAIIYQESYDIAGLVTAKKFDTSLMDSDPFE